MICFLSFALKSQVPIGTSFLGQNYWYANISTDLTIDEWAKVNSSGVQSIRYGGEAPNLSNPILIPGPGIGSYVELLQRFSTKAPNAKPIIELPYRPYSLFSNQPPAPYGPPYYETNPSTDLNYWANTYASNVVQALVTAGYPGLTYTIANEPDACLNCLASDGITPIPPLGYGYNLSSTADLDNIIAYMKAFAIAIKRIDGTAKIIGPDITFFENLSYTYLFNTATNNLGGTIVDGTTSANGKFFVDIISFHMYPQSIVNCADAAASKIAAISYPAGSFKSKLDQLVIIRDNIVPARSVNNLKIAVTEFNISNDNCSLFDGAAVASADSRSYIAGQWTADIMSQALNHSTLVSSNKVNDVECLNFWSIKENSPDRGYLESATGNPRSTYWHFKLMGNYFKSGSLYTNNFYSGSVSGATDFKAFGAKVTGSTQSVVMLMNQSPTIPHSYNVSLNATATGTGSNPVTIGFTMGSPVAGLNHSDNIGPETTQLLVFDCGGRYTGMWEYNILDATNGTPPRWIDNPAFYGNLNITNDYDGSIIPPNGMVTLDFAGATTFSWMPKSGLTVNYGSPNQDGSNVTLTAPLTGGQTTTYIYTATAPDGCMTTESFNVTANGYAVGLFPQGYVTATNATCAGGYADGTATVTTISCPNSCFVTWSNSDGGPTIGGGPTITGRTPGTYYAQIHDLGNAYDPPTSITLRTVINSEFNQFNTIMLPTYWTVDTKVAGTVNIENGGILNIYSLLTEFAPNAKIVVKSGGILNVKSNAVLQSLISCIGLWGIEVQPGGILNLENGSIVKINNSGKLFIDGNSTASGILNYNQGTSVVLMDNSSVMEIKGQLNIGNNANFTYSGNGYVKFSNPNFPSNNITAGTGSSMTFQRSNKSQKALEITQETLYGPANLVSFKVDKCKVELGLDSRIAPLGLTTQIIFTNAKLMSFAGRGLSIFGQPSVIINNSTFEGGKHGIYALLTYGGSPLTINNCTFQNCLVGLKSHDKGVTLNNVRFYDCTDAGWSADAMSQPCVSNNGIFGSKTNPNGYGIYYHGGANGTLFLNNNKVNDNYSDGIYMAGTELKVKCGEIKENYGNGVYLSHNATLNISNDLGGGNVDATGNGINSGNYTIFMNNAKNLWMNNGFNDLSRATSYPCNPHLIGCPLLIKGTMNIAFDPCDNTNCSPITISENQNDWLDHGNIIPRSGEEYDIKTSYNCSSGLRQILLTDVAPSSKVKCADKPKERKFDVLVTCPTCPTINTPEFPNVKLNVAVKSVIDTMGSSGGGNKKAEELFYKILKHPFPSPNKETQVLLEISYQLMLESLGQAYLKNELNATVNTPVLSTNVQQMIEVQDDRLLKYPCADAYQQRLAASMDKAQTYRLAERRDLAIALFDEIITWAATMDQAYVQRWRCITNAEKLLNDAIIYPQDFEAAIASCGTNVKMRSDPETDESITSVSTEREMLNMIPNPASSRATFVYSLPEKTFSAEIRITNMLGELVEKYQIAPGSNSVEVDCSGFRNGIYFYSLITDNSIVNTKKMVITK